MKRSILFILLDSCKRRRTIRGKLETINNREKDLLKDIKNIFPDFGNLPTEGCVANSEGKLFAIN